MVHIGGATKPYSIHSQWLFSWTHEKGFKSRIWNWILVFTLLFLLYYAASDINSPVFVEQLIGWSPLVLFIPSLLHLGPDNNRVTGHHLQYNCFCLTFGYRKTSLNLLSSLSSFLKYWIFSVKIQVLFYWIYFASHRHEAFLDIYINICIYKVWARVDGGGVSTSKKDVERRERACCGDDDPSSVGQSLYLATLLH